MTDRAHVIIETLVERGASDHAHSGATLLTHLLGTYELLQRLGAPEAVSLAGLLHSVYGREEGRGLVSELDRQRLQAMAGRDAEHIAFLYSRMFRHLMRTFDQHGREALLAECVKVGVSPGELQNLLLLDVANLLEQMTRVSFPREWVEADLLRLVKLGDHLPTSLATEIRSLFAAPHVRGETVG
jgi:hypothetical protein